MRLLTLDTETDGVDTSRDHVVTCFLGLMDESGHFLLKQDWLLNFGGEIPKGASDVHGISTERMHAHGRRDLAQVFTEIFNIIEAECIGNGVPLVAYNCTFDLTLLETERRRHLPERAPLDFSRINVLDPLVLDRRIYKFRRGTGARKLTAVAPIYGVPVEENAHDAAADCLMAGRIALQQLRHEYMQGQTITRLQGYQKKWRAEQQADLENWFRTKAPLDRRDPSMTMPREWPIIPAATAA